jgi:MFS family permease
MRRSASPLRQSLRASTLDGIFFSAMAGFGDHYFSAFALYLGAGPFQVGMLTTIPMLLGAAFQLVVPAASRRFGAKPWVVGSAVAQAMALLPMAMLPWAVADGFVWLLPCVCLYWMFGLGLSPAWNAWMALIIPASIRSRYFGRRNTPCFLSLLVSGLTAGMILHTMKKSGLDAAWGFLVIFLMAACFRLVSAWSMGLQMDPPRDVQAKEVRLPALRERLAGGPHTRLILLLVAMTSCVHLTAAYFTPYMLKVLELSYAEFTLLISAVLVGRAVSSPYWGEIARSYGNRRALQVAVFLVVPLSGLWTVSQNFYFLLAVQLFGGFAWAGVDLANTLNLFDCTDERNRADVVSLFNFLNGAAVVAGATIGGVVLRQLGSDGYPILFVGSSLLRLAVVIALARGVGVRRAREQTFPRVFVRVITFARGRA